MERSFWLERWQNQQIGFHQPEINDHLQQFWPRLAVPAGSRVFVPLAGKSLDMLWLRAQGYPVLGIEISQLAVAAFFAENGLRPEVRRRERFEYWECDGLSLLCGDFFDLTADDLAGCGALFDRASLIALPPAMRPRYAHHLLAIMPREAPTLLVTMNYPQQQMQGPPFSVELPEVEALYRADCTIEQLFECEILEQNPHFRNKGLTRLQEQVFLLRRR